MNDSVPRPHPTASLVRSTLTRGALIFGAAFMIGWFVFLFCGIVYFEVLLD